MSGFLWIDGYGIGGVHFRPSRLFDDDGDGSCDVVPNHLNRRYSPLVQGDSDIRMTSESSIRVYVSLER